MKDSLIYIHIGTHKTGTTTLQSIFSDNKKELKKENILYLGKYKSLAKHLAYADTIKQEIIRQTCVDISQKIKDYGNRKNSRFLISNETFCGDKLIGYKNAERVASVLHDIIHEIHELNLGVKIIVYLRRQDKFFESLYMQRIHNGASYTFEEFYNLFDESAFHWNDLLKTYSRFFGKDNMVVRRYGKTFLPTKHSLVREFGKIIQSRSLSSYMVKNIRNPGFSRDTLEIARLISPHLGKGDAKKFRMLLKDVNPKNLYKKQSFFNPQLRVEFMDRFQSSNAAVANKYFNTSGRLFPAPQKDHDYKLHPGLTTESIAVDLAKTIAIINRRTLQLEKEIEGIKMRNTMPLQKKIKRFLVRSLPPGFKTQLKKWIG